MSAEVLRSAAALMRLYANAAKPSPWASGLMGVWSDAEDGGGYIASSVHRHNPCTEAIIDGHDRMHIASWHPAVALAVADWLDAEAVAWQRNFEATQTPSRGIDQPPAIFHGDPARAAENADHHARQALAVARTYLGDQS